MSILFGRKHEKVSNFIVIFFLLRSIKERFPLYLSPEINKPALERFSREKKMKTFLTTNNKSVFFFWGYAFLYTSHHKWSEQSDKFKRNSMNWHFVVKFSRFGRASVNWASTIVCLSTSHTDLIEWFCYIFFVGVARIRKGYSTKDHIINLQNSCKRSYNARHLLNSPANCKIMNEH